MDRSSDSDVTMFASETFYGILERIQTSKLNFSMQLTPFSALISMRKSFMTDRSGSVILPEKSQDQTICESDNLQLERNLNILEKEHAKTVGDLNIAVETIKKLEQKLRHRENDIENLQLSLAKSRETTIKLNQALCDNTKKFAEEKNLIFREHKSEVKRWRKDLGEANRKHIKLEKKFELLQSHTKHEAATMTTVTMTPDIVDPTESNAEEPEPTLMNEEICSICSIPLKNYIPDYFLGEKFNPACLSCKDEDFFGDPFSSFASSDIPPSLVSHWHPSLEYSHGNLGSIRFAEGPLCFAT